VSGSLEQEFTRRRLCYLGIVIGFVIGFAVNLV
jgi:hypothetical protein